VTGESHQWKTGTFSLSGNHRPVDKKPKLNAMKAQIVISLLILLAITSCTNQSDFFEHFNNTNDRIWIGKDFWSVPLEDWKVEDGRLHCNGIVPQSRVNLLTYVLSEGSGEFEASVIISLLEKGNTPGSAGFLIGLKDEEDPDVRAACYFGKGISAGVSAKGYAFLKNKKVELPAKFDFEEFNITIKGSDSRIKMEITDKNGLRVKDISAGTDNLSGLVAVAANIITGDNEPPGNSYFTFDNLKLSGSKVIHRPANAFGPVLWSMYTTNKNQVKLMALFPPLGEHDNQEVNLHLKQGLLWKHVATETIEPDSRTAIFKIDNWDASRNVDYRVEYLLKDKKGTVTTEHYQGTIRRDPVNRPLKFGSLTCQFTSGYPYTPLIKNLTKLDPDLLYFSGDQIYEPNGGYQIKRDPEDVSIVNYLGKYYMFGWAFGDLMRNRPTICTPDDHDVYHGNLWGEAGEAMPEGAGTSDSRGFRQSVKMVNAVNRTQCGHLPDPFDPTPIKRRMSVWYTSLTYGRISFAIISDRIFKTAPEAVSDWIGRHDHMQEPREDLSFLDKQGVELIGDRQTAFLENWIEDWEGADMKVLLSQTVFANVATHHGSLENYLYGDLDSGGWPKSGRDKLIRLLRKGAAFHINGDQHLTSLVQYGLNDYRDAGWSYSPPAICNFYMRWFLPDELGIQPVERPEHGYPNTGYYEDSFGNKNYVYAVGNPGKILTDNSSRYNNAQLRTSGFGLITFDKQNRTIDIDSWRFQADVNDSNPIRDQFPGWPLQISQFDNLGTGASYFLPLITINKPDQVIRIENEETRELVNIYRLKGNEVQPALFEGGIFSVSVGEGENCITVEGLNALKDENTEEIRIELQ
jgi:alkaline phosphatase D